MTDTTASGLVYLAHADADPHPMHVDADHKPGFFARWFFSTNHKDIARCT
jgi:cytochrome c oxidase subunit 1